MKKVLKVLALVFLLLGCVQKIDSITFSESNLVIDVGEVRKIEFTTNLSDNSRSDLVWSSSDNNIASVDQEGNLTGLAEGTATITLVGDKKITSTTSVTVKNVMAVSITIEGNQVIEMGLNSQLSVKFEPSNTTNKEINWSSSNTNIITVDDSGKLTPVKVGTVTITAESSNGLKATYEVKSQILLTSIILSKSSIDLHAGSYSTVLVTYSPTNATSKTVTWSSSVPAIASVDSTGKIKGVSFGTAIITATTSNGLAASVNVTVTAKAPATIYFTSYEIDYVGGVTFDFKFRNNSNKTINYITVKWYCFNAVGDTVYDEISGKNYVHLRFTGPLKPGAITSTKNNSTRFYNRNVRSVSLSEMIIDYADGTSLTINDSNSGRYYDWSVFK